MAISRRQSTPAGFGAPFWARRILDAMHLGNGGSAALITPVLEELIAQTRLDEALCCEQAIRNMGVLVPGTMLNRLATHRHDLRAAKRRAK